MSIIRVNFYLLLKNVYGEKFDAPYNSTRRIKMNAVSVTEKNFEEEVLKSSTPVLVDFWAEWCGPCKVISPIIDEIATELDGKLKVVKVNVDEAQELATKYSVMSIPTLIIFKQGEVVDQSVGAASKDKLLRSGRAGVGQ